MEGVYQMTYQCPVCGYDQLRRPPEDFCICPCCFTEFESDDLDYTIEELRDQWIAAGFPWRSHFVPRPRDWNPMFQLMRLLSPMPIMTSVSETGIGVPGSAQTIYVAQTQADVFLLHSSPNDQLVPVRSGSSSCVSMEPAYA